MRGLIWRGWVYRKALMEVKAAGVKELHTDVQAQQVIFDTLKMVRALENSGFTKSQAEILSDALVGISTDSTRANRDFLATKNDFNDLKSELQILEKADFAVLKSDLQILERKMETKIAAIYTEMERSTYAKMSLSVFPEILKTHTRILIHYSETCVALS